MQFLYVSDPQIKEQLIKQQFEIFQEFNSTNKTVWVFVLTPDSLNFCFTELKGFETARKNNDCFITNKLMMCF